MAQEAALADAEAVARPADEEVPLVVAVAADQVVVADQAAVAAVANSTFRMKAGRQEEKSASQEVEVVQS